jgi:acetyl esterase/lipase
VTRARALALTVVSALLVAACGSSTQRIPPRLSPTSLDPGIRRPPPSPPGPPVDGPGSDLATHPGRPFVAGKGGVGGYTIYEPNPRPESAPVLVLIHGDCAVPSNCRVNDVSNVGVMAAALEHFAMKGSIVIYPRYQRSSNSPFPSRQTETAISGIKAAIVDLNQSGRTRPDLSNFGVVGHSRGAYLGAHIVALAASQGLPHPDYFLSMAPGDEPHNKIPREDYGKIPSDMRLLVTVGDRDSLNGEASGNYGAGKLWDGTPHIPLARRDYVRMRSDLRGRPPILAVHSFPSDERLDSLDYYVFWKFTDALSECSRQGVFCEYSLGDTPEQRFMGAWSDGVPVRELCVTDDRQETWAASCANSLG